MIIETSTWGQLDINEEAVYQFPKGIPGFEEETAFAVIALEEGPFSYLQSLKSDSLVFLLADPFSFYADYEFELPDTDAEELEIEDSVWVRSIVTLKEQVEESTLNLLAPIVMNPQKRMGKQVVLIKTAYQTKQTLWNSIQGQKEVD